MGFTVTAAGIGGQVLVQSAIHDEMRGRVMGLWGIIMREECRTGAVLLGALNSWLGFRWGMVTVTLAFVVVLAYVIPRSNQLAARLEAATDRRTRKLGSAVPKPAATWRFNDQDVARGHLRLI